MKITGIARVLALGVAMGGAGCAAAPMRAAASPAPAIVVDTPAAVAAPAPPPPPPAERGFADSSVWAARAAFGDVRHAELELAASTGSCHSACRALGAMDDAAGRLCSLASEQEGRRECEESKAKVLAARVRVASSCGACPGTSVDPTVPVPSPQPR